MQMAYVISIFDKLQIDNRLLLPHIAELDNHICDLTQLPNLNI